MKELEFGIYHFRRAESQNRQIQANYGVWWLYSNVTTRRHLCDVYTAKFLILHAWFTVMQNIHSFRASCLWGNMAGTEARIFVFVFVYSLTSFMIWKEKKRTMVSAPNKKAFYTSNEWLWLLAPQITDNSSICSTDRLEKTKQKKTKKKTHRSLALLVCHGLSIWKAVYRCICMG